MSSCRRTDSGLSAGWCFNQMRTYKASEMEIDERLRLDKRSDARAFCNYFNSEQELPAGFYDLQDKIRDGLEKEFFSNFDDGVDRSHLKPWQRGENKFFYFPAELLISERIIIEISHEILNDTLIGLILSYLGKCHACYCIIIAVYHEIIKGSKYVGRFVIDLAEIAVEASLAEIWSKQVLFMAIEN